MLNNLSIRVRLLSGFMILIVVFGSLLIFSIDRMWSLSELTGKMYRHPLIVSNAVLRVNVNIIKIHRTMKDIALAHNIDDIRSNAKIVDLLETEVYKDFEIIADRFLGEKEMYELPLQHFEDWKLIREEVITLMHAGKHDDASAITKGKGAMHLQELEDSISRLIDFAQKKASSFLRDAESTRDNALILVYSLIVIATIGMVIFALMLTRSIMKPINILKAAAIKVGEGELDTEIDIVPTDEIGGLAGDFNEMRLRLKESYSGLESQVVEKTRELSETLEISRENNVQLRGTQDAMLNLVEDLEASKEEIEREKVNLEDAKDKLQVLNIELNRKNAELESILFAASHDLRTPLVNIQGFGKELQYSIKDLASEIGKIEIPLNTNKKLSSLIEKDIPDALGFICNGTAKMDALLKALLQISRLGRFELKLESLDMNRLLSDVITNLEFRLKENNIKTEVSDLPACTADSTQMNQVLTNLIENAIKYRDPERDGVIWVSGHKEKDRSVYCIEDNGIGIAPEYQDQIFKLFHRLDPEGSMGEGLGLTIVRKIVEKHNGMIWVESEAGKGSRFFVALPRKTGNRE